MSTLPPPGLEARCNACRAAGRTNSCQTARCTLTIKRCHESRRPSSCKNASSVRAPRGQASSQKIPFQTRCSCNGLPKNLRMLHAPSPSVRIRSNSRGAPSSGKPASSGRTLQRSPCVGQSQETAANGEDSDHEVTSAAENTSKASANSPTPCRHPAPPSKSPKRTWEGMQVCTSQYRDRRCDLAKTLHTQKP